MTRAFDKIDKKIITEFINNMGMLDALLRMPRRGIDSLPSQEFHDLEKSYLQGYSAGEKFRVDAETNETGFWAVSFEAAGVTVNVIRKTSTC